MLFSDWPVQMTSHLARPAPYQSADRPSAATSSYRPRTNHPAIRRMTTTPYPYLIFYEVTEGEIIIHAVRHAARDPTGMPGSA
jgi:plasmid stabilization system protein ParE